MEITLVPQHADSRDSGYIISPLLMGVQGFLPITQKIYASGFFVNQQEGFLFSPSEVETLFISSFSTEQVGTGSNLFGLCEEVFSWQAATAADIEDNIVSVENMLGLIKATLSLTVTELAAALQVERPTIYAWLRCESVPQPRNRDRLVIIHSLAEEWAKHSNLPAGDVIRTRTKTNPSIMNEMSKEVINEKYVRTLIRERASSVRSLMPPASFRARLAQKGLSIEANTEGQDELDRITGRRIAPDPE